MSDAEAAMLIAANPAISEQNVIAFLQADPDFFVRNNDLVDTLAISHGAQGCVSLVTLRLERQRQRIADLELQLQQLVAIAADNDKLFRIYADIYTALFNCTSVMQMQRILVTQIQSQLPLAAVNLHLNEACFHLKSQYLPLAISAGQLVRIRQKQFAGGDHYFGPVTGADKALLFGQDALVNSMALMALGERGEYGLLAIGSANADHYQVGMDNLLLGQLCRIISTLLPQLMPSRDNAIKK
ncbi:DUF484 family protein [Moritella yayanosii]|uniref:DUF484 domain-containing protein n=1 Tax=Moritella yayanosii TaxID=69539 RepID=A0A330LSX4_9GAMM|nr:DUF484 family protein [Moritella yayanosii]SQD79512.1 conserved protein of unknown function [Moritella yayanosii]